MIEFIGDAEIKKAILSVIALILVFSLRYLCYRILSNLKFDQIDIKRKIFLQIKYGSYILVFSSLIVVWASELRALTISLLAVGLIGFVVGTKELSVCFLGGVYKKTLRLFDIGDRIKIEQFRGTVIDHNLFGTVILEIGPNSVIHQHTGRTVTIPNSLFLTKPLENESFTKKYVFHIFFIPIPQTANWAAHESALLDAAKKNCGQYLDEAKEEMEDLGEQQGIDAPSIEPKIWLNMETSAEVKLYLRFSVPSDIKGRVEQLIIRDYLNAVAKLKTKS